MSKPESCELGDLIEFQRGFDLPKSQFVTGKYPVQSSNGVLGYHNEFKVTGPGITIGRSGTVGLPHYLESDFFPHNTTLFIKDFKGNDIRYIYYLIKSLELGSKKSGSGVPTMNRNHLHPLKIKAHRELLEQKKIANILHALDKKIELNNRINSELEAMAKTLYDYWFVQFDFPDANGKPYKSSGGKMVYNSTLKREIPEDWECGYLEALGKIVGGSTPSTKNSKNFSENGIPWITPNDLSNNKGNKFISRGAQDLSPEGVKDASLKMYPKGTVLLSSRAPIGYMAIAKTELTTNQGFKSFIPLKRFSTEFIYFTIQISLKAITQYASGSTFKEISASTLKTVDVVLPKENVHDDFTKYIKKIFTKQGILESENQKLIELRDWLLPMLMNGQVTIE